MQARMNNVRTVVIKIMMSNLFDAWKFCKQDISRSEQSSQSDSSVEVMFQNSISLMKQTLRK